MKRFLILILITILVGSVSFFIYWVIKHSDTYKYSEYQKWVMASEKRNSGLVKFDMWRVSDGAIMHDIVLNKQKHCPYCSFKYGDTISVWVDVYETYDSLPAYKIHLSDFRSSKCHYD